MNCCDPRQIIFSKDDHNNISYHTYSFKNVTLTLLLTTGRSVLGLFPLKAGWAFVIASTYRMWWNWPICHFLCEVIQMSRLLPCSLWTLALVEVSYHTNNPTVLRLACCEGAQTSSQGETTWRSLRLDGEREMPSQPQLLQSFTISTPITGWEIDPVLHSG